MCTACWIENGRAAVVSRATIRAARSINRLYACAGGEAGGALHIVLDGWNVADPCLAYCRDVLHGRRKRYAISDPGLILAELEVLQRIEDLGIQERCSALALSEHLIEMPPSILEPRHKRLRSHRPHPGLWQAARAARNGGAADDEASPSWRIDRVAADQSRTTDHRFRLLDC